VLHSLNILAAQWPPLCSILLGTVLSKCTSIYRSHVPQTRTHIHMSDTQPGWRYWACRYHITTIRFRFMIISYSIFSHPEQRCFPPANIEQPRCHSAPSSLTPPRSTIPLRTRTSGRIERGRRARGFQAESTPGAGVSHNHSNRMASTAMILSTDRFGIDLA
jgi:hypothetical protein